MSVIVAVLLGLVALLFATLFGIGVEENKPNSAAHRIAALAIAVVLMGCALWVNRCPS